MAGHYRSTEVVIFIFVVHLIKFNQTAFYGGCAIPIENMRYGLAQFLHDSIILRDTHGRYGCSFLLISNKINCIVNCLANV